MYTPPEHTIISEDRKCVNVIIILVLLYKYNLLPVFDIKSYAMKKRKKGCALVVTPNTKPLSMYE